MNVRSVAAGSAVLALVASPFLAYATVPDAPEQFAAPVHPGEVWEMTGEISPAGEQVMLAGAAQRRTELIAEDRAQAAQVAAAAAAQLAAEAAAEIPEPTPPADEADAQQIVAAQASKAFNYRPGPGINTAEVRALVIKHFPADQVGNAMAVARCESGHSNAIGSVNRNGTRDWGVFQLNDGGTLQGALHRVGVGFGSMAQAQQLALDAETNIRAARAIWASRGWAPWVCAYKTGVVAGLYSRAPGPMYGQFNGDGLPGTPWTPAPPPPSEPPVNPAPPVSAPPVSIPQPVSPEPSPGTTPGDETPADSEATESPAAGGSGSGTLPED